jgi:hypothetical protein
MNLKTEAYVNLHKTKKAGKLVYSIRQKGLVVDHVSGILLKDVRLAVGKKGRERVLRERKKNVHAFVRGEGLSADDISRFERAVEDDALARVPIRYNPYKGPAFTRTDTGEDMFHAKYVSLTPTGAYAWV